MKQLTIVLFALLGAGFAGACIQYQFFTWHPTNDDAIVIGVHMQEALKCIDSCDKLRPVEIDEKLTSSEKWDKLNLAPAFKTWNDCRDRCFKMVPERMFDALGC